MTDFIDTLPAPQTNARHAENLALAQQLRENPGRWTRYPYPLDRPRGLRYRITHNKVAAFRPGFDAEIRGGEVFIRYNP